MANKVTYNPDTKIIKVKTGVTDIDVKVDLYSDTKEDWQTDTDLAKFEFPFRTVGGDPTTPGQFTPSYFFLKYPWSIETNGDGAVLNVALNLYAEDVNGDGSRDPFIRLAGDAVSNKISDIPGLDEEAQEAIKFEAFQNRVTIDTINGASGTDYPLGTTKDPVDNVADALLIAARIGVGQLFFKNDHTISVDVSGFELIGDAPSKCTLTFDSGSTTTGAEIFDATVTGDVGDIAGMTGCHILTVTNLKNAGSGSVNLHDCSLEGSITLDPTATGHIHLANCQSGVAGQSTPFLDMNGASSDIIGRSYVGGLEMRNLNQGQVGSLDILSGQLKIASSCTDGAITVRGLAKVTDNSSGTFSLINESVYDRTDEMHKLQGLKQGSPMTVTPTSRTVSGEGIDLDITGDGVTSSTVTRQ